MKQPEFLTNTLKKMAEDLVDSPVDTKDEQARRTNITEIFNRELFQFMIENREYINMNINSPTRSGKSTVGMALGYNIQTAISSIIKGAPGWTVNNIVRSTYELMRKVQDPSLNNMIMVIDEFDDMDQTQMNSTTEEASHKSFSKQHAARYLHTIYISPTDLPNQLSNILITVDQADKKSGITKCYVSYKFQRGERVHTPLIGYILVDVSKIVKNWVSQKIEQKFYSPNRKKYQKEIYHWREKDWYIDYQCRKFIKIDMLSEHGVFHTRDLDYSDIYLECIDDLKPLTRIRGAIGVKNVKSHLKILLRKYKIPSSILGAQLMSEQVDSVLDNYKIFYELRDKANILRVKFNNNKIDKSTFDSEMKDLTDYQKMLITEANTHEDELLKLSKLKKLFYDEK